MKIGTIRNRSGKSRTERQQQTAVTVVKVQTEKMAGPGVMGALKERGN